MIDECNSCVSIKLEESGVTFRRQSYKNTFKIMLNILLIISGSMVITLASAVKYRKF